MQWATFLCASWDRCVVRLHRRFKNWVCELLMMGSVWVVVGNGV